MSVDSEKIEVFSSHFPMAGAFSWMDIYALEESFQDLRWLWTSCLLLEQFGWYEINKMFSAVFTFSRISIFSRTHCREQMLSSARQQTWGKRWFKEILTLYMYYITKVADRPPSPPKSLLSQAHPGTAIIKSFHLAFSCQSTSHKLFVTITLFITWFFSHKLAQIPDLGSKTRRIHRSHCWAQSIINQKEKPPGLSLVVCGVALAAAATLDQCRLGAFGNCQSTVIDPLLDKRLPLLLHLIAGHLCRGHHGQPLCSYASLQSSNVTYLLKL